MPTLFISYRRTDSPDTVKLIHERLKRRLPRWEIFYDHESIPLGEQFPERLRAKVASAAVVLVIIGPKWLEILQERKSAAIDHVRAEVRLALEATTSVVPVLVGHARMPTDADLADFADLQPLLQRNGCPVRPDPDFDGDLEPIIAHLKQFDSDEAIGATLADKYTLTAEIAHGGMGVVYLAEQKQPVRRTVAVKLIKPGMDSRDVLARFDAERQALAVMDHPNIAKVHDAGMTASGRPFFVMEYVKGVPITQYCDEKKLTPQERLNLFIPVCNAVQHAHQKGIIHRDLKPSNVLVAVVDGKPVPKVIDFGLAKALGQKLTDKTLYTALDTRIGTLEYSAPEQAAGRSFDVDTRSDIYSLGVLLYELLTGAPPFTQEELLKVGEEEMRRVIREDEPTRPSKKLSSSGELPAIAAKRHLEPNKLTRLVQGELDWIVMKCLEKKKEDRYPTANEVGQELQRFLADEPVQVRGPSAAYRLRKFVRRHKAGLLTAAGVLMVVVLAVGGVGWAQWDRAAQQAERRLEQAQRSADTKSAVSVALAKAEQLAEQARQMPSISSAESAAVLVVWRQADDALAQAVAVLRTGAANDDLEQRIAAVRAQLEDGRLQTERRQTRALRKEQLFRDLDDARMTRPTLKGLDLVWDGAAVKYAAAFARFGLQIQSEQTEVLAQRIRAEEPEVRDALIVALDHWAYGARPPVDASLLAISRVADQDAWRRVYRQAVVARDSTALVRLSKEARRLALPPISLHLLALALYKNEQRKESRDLLRWANVLYPTDFWIALELGIGNGSQANAAAPTDLEERIGYCRVAVALRPDASTAHLCLGAALYAKEEWDDAMAEFKKAVALDPKDPMAHLCLGGALYAKEEWDDAIAELQEVIALDPKDIMAHLCLGPALQAKKKQLDDANAPKGALAHVNLGKALYAKNQLNDAIAEFKKAIAIDSKHALAHHNLGLALYARSQLDDNVGNLLGSLNETIYSIVPVYEYAHRYAYDTHNHGLALKSNNLDDAITEYNKAIALDPQDALFHFNLGLALQAKNQLDEAITEYNNAVALDPKHAQAHGALGRNLLRKGRFAEAKKRLQQALDLLPEKEPPRPTVLRERDLCAALLTWEAKLPDILAGKAQPKDNGDWLGSIAVCIFQQRHADAVKVYGNAFTADATLADDLKAGHRYNAACSAALAVSGKGKDADKLTEQERADLRKQTLQWLRADLAAWGKLLDIDADKARPVVQDKMNDWKAATDLAGVRDPKALEKLPPDERDAWQKLWQDVDTLLAKALEKK